MGLEHFKRFIYTFAEEYSKTYEEIESLGDFFYLTVEKDFERLEELIARINHTNNETKCGNVTLTDLIAKRDCLNGKIRIMRSFLDSASEKVTRYSKTEIRIMSTVPVAELQKQVDQLSKELRETDETIQGLNWTTELI